MPFRSHHPACDAALWRHVHGKVNADFIDTGEQSLKNIPRPVRVYCLKIEEAHAPSRRASIA